jgi:acetyltransferase-like isoleucine patch superfamily enzyme
MRIVDLLKSPLRNHSLLTKFLNKVLFDNQVKLVGINNYVQIEWINCRKTKIWILGNNNKISIDKECRLNNCSVFISGENNQIYIQSGCSLKDTEFYIEDNGNVINLKDHTTVHGKTCFACIEGCRIEIGEDCMFSSDVTLRTGDSHSIIDLSGTRINTSKDIIIGDHVWFGNMTKIFKNVHIANNSIIGAGSVVTKSFESPNIIIAGNPAKIVKENINWLRERI